VTQVERLRFEPVSRDQARRTLEVQIKQLRIKGPSEELTRLLQFQKHYF